MKTFRRILIFGFFGYNNLGDELLLFTLLKNVFKDNKITVLYNPKVKIKVGNFADNKISVVSRWNYLKIISKICNSDTLICCGGLFQDKTSFFSLLYYLSLIIIGYVFKKKILVLGTEIIVEKLSLKYIFFFIKKVNFIGIRNKSNLNTLINKSAKKLNNVHFLPDLCFLLYSDKSEESLSKINLVKKIAFILKSDNIKDFEIQLIKNIISHLSTFYKIILIPFFLGEDRNDFDYRVSYGLLIKFPNTQLRIWDKAENYSGLFSDIDFVITSRFHGMIISLLLNIPFVCVSNDEKLLGVLKDYNLRDFDYTKIKSNLLLKNYNFDKINQITKSNYLILKREFSQLKSVGFF